MSKPLKARAMLGAIAGACPGGIKYALSLYGLTCCCLSKGEVVIGAECRSEEEYQRGAQPDTGTPSKPLD